MIDGVKTSSGPVGQKRKGAASYFLFLLGVTINVIRITVCSNNKYEIRIIVCKWICSADDIDFQPSEQS